MRYAATLIAVRDMERSKAFYRDLLGMEVTADFGANVTLDNVLALQTVESWREFIGGRETGFHSNSGELYFETDDLDGFLRRLEDFAVEYVHPPLTHGWGQRAVRFYDPDGHIVEVGEELGLVMRRFAEQGLTEEEIAVRMDVPLAFVREALSR